LIKKLWETDGKITDMPVIKKQRKKFINTIAS